MRPSSPSAAPFGAPHPVQARLLWRGAPRVVQGVLVPGFLLVGGRVHVRLEDVRPPLPGAEGRDVWVDAAGLTPLAEAADASFILRSAMHELPGDQTWDFALRTLSVTLSQFVSAGGVSVTLSPGAASMMEFCIVIDVPTASRALDDAEGNGRLDGGVEYLWKFRLATRPGTSRAAAWAPPPPPFAEADIVRKGERGAPGRIDREQAAHHIGQLPLWLTTRRFWSAFRWREHRLQHVVQFSVEENRRRTFVRRFRMAPPRRPAPPA